MLDRKLNDWYVASTADIPGFNSEESYALIGSTLTEAGGRPAVLRTTAINREEFPVGSLFEEGVVESAQFRYTLGSRYRGESE